MSVMTRGVIQMPYNLAMNSELNRRQFYSHAQVLLAEHDLAHKHWENESNNIQALMAEISRIKAENESLRTALMKIRDEVDDLRICEIAADALIDANRSPENH